MFSTLTADPEDRIMRTMVLYRQDPRPEKLDLGIGVYKDAAGLTPIMRAVKAAEQQLWQQENTKTYVGLVGDPAFNAAMVSMVLGEGGIDPARVASAATAGGTGAVRAAFELIKLGAPEATVWMSNPSWSNHPNMLDYLEIPRKDYRYFDPASGRLDFDGMLADLRTAQPGDIVLLHGCCHNPTGLNLTHGQWDQVADLMLDRRLIPMIDIAYQGFGDGLDEDAYGVRLLAAKFAEILIAASCSKNFGIYRERTGCFMAIGQSEETIARVQSKMALINRLNYSFPPDHGARLVSMVLSDPNLRADWEQELAGIRAGMLDLRHQLAEELRLQTRSNRFDFVVEHRGMFSMLGLSEAQVETMRTDHAVYVISDSRMNIAGLNTDSVPVLAKAVAAVI